MCSYYDYLDDYRFMHPEEFEDSKYNQDKTLIVEEVCVKLCNEI